MDMATVESKRIAKLRRTIAQQLPTFPNNKETRAMLASESLSELFVHYTNWAIRYVPPRPRAIVSDPSFELDERMRTNSAGINFLLDKVGRGLDLTTHLSIDPHTRGYTPHASERGESVDKWADKDFMLLIMGYHHFHLGTTVTANGHIKRTDDLLFARISRDSFTIIGIYNHSAFDKPVASDGRMTPERERLWADFEKDCAKDREPGGVYITALIATSGHSLELVRLAAEYARIIYQLDAKLDDPKYIDSLYEKRMIIKPKSPKLNWHFNCLDLGWLDQNKNFFVLRHGPL